MRIKGVIVLTMLSLAGCEPRLETGYVPRPLNATSDDRRAYYAPEFTPESHPPKDHNNAGDFQGLPE